MRYNSVRHTLFEWFWHFCSFQRTYRKVEWRTQTINEEVVWSFSIFWLVLLLPLLLFLLRLLLRFCHYSRTSGCKGKESGWSDVISSKKKKKHMILTSTLRIYIYCTWEVKLQECSVCDLTFISLLHDALLYTFFVSFLLSSLYAFLRFFLYQRVFSCRFLWSRWSKTQNVRISPDRPKFFFSTRFGSHLFSLICSFRSVGLWYYNIFHYQSNAMRSVWGDEPLSMVTKKICGQHRRAHRPPLLHHLIQVAHTHSFYFPFKSNLLFNTI